MLNVAVLSVANKPFTLSIFILNVVILSIAMVNVVARHQCVNCDAKMFYKICPSATISGNSMDPFPSASAFEMISFNLKNIEVKPPEACTIKLFTDFCNKLECLSLASLSSLV
jgi:hypothetical protein